MQPRVRGLRRSKMTDKEETKQLNDFKKKAEGKVEEKKEEKKAKEKPKEEIPKKEEAIAKANSMRASKKHCMYLCDFIRNKKIDPAIADLEQVIKMKKAVPFRGEIPHRKGKGIMSGRYPVKAAGLFISLLKALKGNTIVNGLDLDKAIICHASASWDARPLRRGSVQTKRTNVILKAKEVKR